MRDCVSVLLGSLLRSQAKQGRLGDACSCVVGLTLSIRKRAVWPSFCIKPAILGSSRRWASTAAKRPVERAGGLAVTHLRGEDERGGAGVGGLVHVGARLDELLHDLEVPVLRRDDQRRGLRLSRASRESLGPLL